MNQLGMRTPISFIKNSNLRAIDFGAFDHIISLCNNFTSYSPCFGKGKNQTGI